MDLWAVGRLILASAAIMGSPGPSTISATAVGAAFGVRRSIPYVAGLVAGTFSVLLVVAAGVVSVLLSVPAAGPVLGAVSLAYITYLAWRIATAPPLRADGTVNAAPALPGGFVLALANPKAYLAIAAVFSGTVVIAGDATADALAKITLLGGMIVLIHLFWLLAGASLSRVLRDPVWSRVINVALAVALLGVTIAALV